MNKHSKLTPVWLFLTISLIVAVIVLPYVSTDTAFILGWDMRTIYSSNFENLRTMLTAFKEQGTLPFWSWVNFLGNDFYSSKLFYFTDFFEYFFALTDMPYTTAILWMTWLRFLAAGFCFYIFARNRKYSDRTCLCGSLMFTFSAYLLQVMRDTFFAGFMCFLPLYFMAVDRYIEKKRPWMYIFMVFFLFVNNYYLFYMTSLFTILYFIYRWTKTYDSMKGMMKEAFKLIGWYMVGFLLSGIVVVPEILSILSNSRVGQRSAVLVYESLQPYLEYITGWFTPVSMLANRGTSISQLYLYDTANHQLMAMYVWASSFVTLLLPQVLLNKEKDGKRDRIIFGILAGIGCIPILSSIMHGFSEPSFRWMCNTTFLCIVFILPYVEHPEHIQRPLLKISALVLIPVLLLSPFLLSLLLKTGMDTVFEEYYLFAGSALFLALTAVCLFKNARKCFLLVLIGELSFVSYFSFFGSPALSNIKRTDADRYPVIMGAKEYYNTWSLSLAEENTSSFYRTYIDPVSVYWSMGTNYNLDADIMGLLSYDSTYLASTNDLVRLDPDRVIDYLPWTFDIENPDLMTLACAKYGIVANDVPCPFKNGVLIGHFTESMSVYENLDYFNLGKTYTSLMTYDEYDPSMSEAVTEKVICHEADKNEILSLLSDEEVACTDALTQGNQAYAFLTTTKNGFAIVSIPYDKGWSVQVNGKPVKTYAVNGGMIGFAVEAGENEVQFHFTPYGLKAGACLSIAGGVVLLVSILIHIFMKKSC